MSNRFIMPLPPMSNVGYAYEGSGSLLMMERVTRFFSKCSSVEQDSVLFDLVYLEREKLL